jgi:hypothetical protein
MGKHGKSHDGTWVGGGARGKTACPKRSIIREALIPVSKTTIEGNWPMGCAPSSNEDYQDYGLHGYT